MRIAIVNDVLTAVEAMRRALSQARGHELAWVARDGAEAVRRCAVDTPDLVLMDLIMPEMDGVEATRQIMARNPCAIVVVTADVNRNSSKVFEALGAGALDAVDTPRPGKNRLLWRTGCPARQNSHHQPPASLGPGQTDPARPAAKPTARIAPAACRHRRLRRRAGRPGARPLRPPADFSAPVVIVQHVDARFAESLAAWLGGKTRARRPPGRGRRPPAGRHRPARRPRKSSRLHQPQPPRLHQSADGLRLSPFH